MITGLREMEDEICEAVYKDLGRDKFISKLAEITLCVATAEHDIQHVDSYAKEYEEPTELVLGPGTTLIKYEPLGVMAIFGAWNYPFTVVLKPLI